MKNKNSNSNNTDTVEKKDSISSRINLKYIVWLILMNVKGCRSDSALLQCDGKGLVIHQATTCRIHQKCTWSHLKVKKHKK